MKLLWSEWPGGITNTGRRLIRTRSIGSKRDDTVFGETRSKGLGKPEQLRTAHFPKLTAPTLFVHGSRDPFGTPAEFKEAVALITAPVQLLEIEGAGHDLGRDREAVAAKIALAFAKFGP